MTIHSLKKMIHAVPFKPFTIRLADGRGVEVPHPDFIGITGGGRTLFVGDETEDEFSIVDLLLVTQLEADISHSANS